MPRFKLFMRETLNSNLRDLFGFKLFMRETLHANRRNLYGSHSLYVRAICIRVSLINSMNYFWFGHGAGISQKLLPHMVDIEENKNGVDLQENKNRNKEFLDSHVLFITEFFNVGIVGALSLTCLVLFVLIELFYVVKTSMRENDHIPSLLFATIISMLIFRLFGSLIVIPFLWFMLGFAFGVCKIYWETYTPGKSRQVV